jgi:ribosomal protein L15
MVVRIACNSSGDGFAGSTKRGTKSPAAFTLARALGRYRLPRNGVDRVANKVDLPTFDALAIQPLRTTMGRTSSLGDTWRRTHKKVRANAPKGSMPLMTRLPKHYHVVPVRHYPSDRCK